MMNYLLLAFFISTAAFPQEYLEDSQIILNLKNKRSVVFNGNDYVIVSKNSVIESEQYKTRLEKAQREIEKLETKVNKDRKKIRSLKIKAAKDRREYYKNLAKARKKIQNQSKAYAGLDNARDQFIVSREEDFEEVPVPTTNTKWRKNRLYGLVGYKHTGRLVIKGKVREDGGITYVVNKEPQMLFGLGITRDVTKNINVTASYIFDDEALLGLGWTF